MSSETQRYQQLVQCCGQCLGFVCCSYQKVQTSTVGMYQRFGKLKQVVEPGLHFCNPLSQVIIPVSLNTKVMTMAKQSVYTRDNMSVYIDTALFYRIVDPYKATYIVKDIITSLMQLTFVTLRTVCGEYNLQEMLIQRVQVNAKIQDFVRLQAQNWGVYVQFLLLKDMNLSKYLQQNLSIVSKTKRIVESRIISAQADLQSAKLYRQAADILDIKAAHQIRFLDTLERIDHMKSQKITILPMVPNYDE